MRVVIPIEIKISLAYVLIGCVWVGFSNEILEFIQVKQVLVSNLKDYIRYGFVVLTAVVLYFFLKRYYSKQKKSEIKICENEKLKTAFIKNISHEIRTPINGIIGFSEMLGDETLSFREKVYYVSIIEKSTQDLLLAINGMMDLSLLESGGMAIEDELFSIKKMLNTIFLQYKNYEKPGVVLEKENEVGSEDDMIVSDEVKIKLVLGHLINNAFKFTAEGCVKIGCYKKEGCIVFYVKDTGVGMSKENQNVIFESFRKVTPSTGEFKSGIGLGLTISKSIASFLKGDLWLESTEDEGSTFYFSIPVTTTYALSDCSYNAHKNKELTFR